MSRVHKSRLAGLARRSYKKTPNVRLDGAAGNHRMSNGGGCLKIDFVGSVPLPVLLA